MSTEKLPAIITAAEKQLVKDLELENIKVADIEALIEATKDIKVVDNDSLEVAKVEKRKFAKYRTGAVSVFKNAREGFIAAQKFVIGKEKDFVAIIAKGEDPLGNEIAAWEAKVKAEQDAKDEEQRVRTVNRINQLTALGAMEDAIPKEMFLDTVRWSRHEIETGEDETFEIILNEFKEKKGQLDWENDQEAKRKELHNSRLMQLQPFMAFVQLDLTAKLNELSEDDFNAMLDKGAIALAKHKADMEALNTQRAEIKQQVYDLRATKIKDLGYTIGDVAIIGFEQQFTLNLLDNEKCDNELFEVNLGNLKLFADKHKASLKAHEEKLAEYERRYSVINELGFVSSGSQFVYQNDILLSKFVVESNEDFDAMIEQTKKEIADYNSQQAAAKAAADLEAENALSDEEKFNNFIANIVNLKEPTLKSKKYNAKLEKVSDLIFQIKNIK